MRLLYADEDEPQAESKTLVAVPLERLRAEFDAGVKHQQADEHWRKQIRIMLSLGSTGITLLLNTMGFATETGPYLTLFFNCVLHVLL